MHCYTIVAVVVVVEHTTAACAQNNCDIGLIQNTCTLFWSISKGNGFYFQIIFLCLLFYLHIYSHFELIQFHLFFLFLSLSSSDFELEALLSRSRSVLKQSNENPEFTLSRGIERWIFFNNLPIG